MKQFYFQILHIKSRHIVYLLFPCFSFGLANLSEPLLIVLDFNVIKLLISAQTLHLLKKHFGLHTNKQQFYTSTTTAHGHLITFGCHFAFRCQLRCRRLRCRRQHVWRLLVLPFLISPIQSIRALKLNASVEGGDVII